MKQLYWIAIGAFLTGLLVWLAFFWQPDALNPELPDQFHNLRQPAGPLPAGDFTVTTPDGIFSLKDYRGKVVLVYFGYTFCPDVCPTMLARLVEVMKALSGDAPQVQVLFVTVDPERDSAEVLKSYTGFFDARIIGLTGSPALGCGPAFVTWSANTLYLVKADGGFSGTSLVKGTELERTTIEALVDWAK